jgi:putative addiction module CopG family antidote
MRLSAMAIQLTPELQEMVDRVLATGAYNDVSAVLEASLQLLEERTRTLDWLRADFQIGEDQIARREVVEYTPDTMRRLIAEAEERSRQGLPVRDAVKPPSSMSVADLAARS